jgi:hypothetical protein
MEVRVEFLILWLVAATIVSMIARTKGRNAHSSPARNAPRVMTQRTRGQDRGEAPWSNANAFAPRLATRPAVERGCVKPRMVWTFLPV